MIRILTLVGCVAFLTACANTQEQYYQAIAETNKSIAIQQAERYKALASMAQSGDPATAGAAVMAMALSTDKAIAPNFVESSAVTWGRILATPIATVAGLAIQADVSKHMATQNTNVAIAREGTVQGAFASLGALQASSIASTEILGQVATSGLEAVQNVSQDALGALVTTNATGINGVTNTAVEAFGTIESISVNNNGLIQGLSNSLQPIVPIVVGPETSMALPPLVDPAL